MSAVLVSVALAESDGEPVMADSALSALETVLLLLSLDRACLPLPMPFGHAFSPRSSFEWAAGFEQTQYP